MTNPNEHISFRTEQDRDGRSIPVPPQPRVSDEEWGEDDPILDALFATVKATLRVWWGWSDVQDAELPEWDLEHLEGSAYRVATVLRLAGWTMSPAEGVRPGFPCGAGHFCCDESGSPPIHEHDLDQEDCPACAVFFSAGSVGVGIGDANTDGAP